MRILVVEDENSIARFVSQGLREADYVVDVARTGPEGLDYALAAEYDIILLDVMLPGISGLDVLRRLRPQSRVPVLLLTARGEDVDRIVGLELGADDYVPKPFNTRELLARIQAILRRVQGGQAPGSVVVVGRPLLLRARPFPQSLSSMKTSMATCWRTRWARRRSTTLRRGAPLRTRAGRR